MLRFGVLGGWDYGCWMPGFGSVGPGGGCLGVGAGVLAAWRVPGFLRQDLETGGVAWGLISVRGLRSDSEA